MSHSQFNGDGVATEASTYCRTMATYTPVDARAISPSS